MKCFGKIQIEFMNNFFVLYIYKCQTDPYQHTAPVEEVVVVDQDPQPHLVPELHLVLVQDPHLADVPHLVDEPEPAHDLVRHIPLK